MLRRPPALRTETPWARLADDAACKPDNPTYICEPVSCPCSGEDTECVPGCLADAECKGWEVCGANNRCQGKPCAADGDCPDNFACNVDLQCARKKCVGPADCAG